MITRRRLLMGLAGGVAAATAAATLVRQTRGKPWSLTQPVHGDRPHAGLVPGDYLQYRPADNECNPLRAFVRGETTYEEYAG